jgi:hypothetical protein
MAFADLALIGGIGWAAHEAILSLQKDRFIDCEREKRKLTVGNIPEEIKFGGLRPPEQIDIGPDDECERLARAIRSTSFKKLPWYKRYLTYLMFYFGCK